MPPARQNTSTLQTAGKTADNILKGRGGSITIGEEEGCGSYPAKCSFQGSGRPPGRACNHWQRCWFCGVGSRKFAGGDQTPKLLPHPQLLSAFGLLNKNPPPTASCMHGNRQRPAKPEGQTGNQYSSQPTLLPVQAWEEGHPPPCCTQQPRCSLQTSTRGAANPRTCLHTPDDACTTHSVRCCSRAACQTGRAAPWSRTRA